MIHVHAINEPMIASFMSSLITVITIITISIAIHAGVWFYRQTHPNEVPDHQEPQDSSDEGVYEPVDDISAMTISMTTNEAYVTTKT